MPEPLSEPLSDANIWIVTDDAVDLQVADGAKGDWGDALRSPTVLAKGVKLKAADLQQKMSDFLRIVGYIFQQAEQQANLAAAPANPTAPKAQLQLDEIELAVEISAEGEVKLIAGGKATGKGAIKLKFKRVAGK